jgi:hypothetical protein
VFQQREDLQVRDVPTDCEHLGCFEVRYINRYIVLRFYEVEDLISDNKWSLLNR